MNNAPKTKVKKTMWMKRFEQHERYVNTIMNFQPIPLPTAEYNKLVNRFATKMKFSSEQATLDYLGKRWSEFCLDAHETLRANLQPGAVKWGFALDLGRFPCAMIDRIFCLNTQCKKEEVSTSVMVNREEIPVRILKYHFLLEIGFPKLDTEDCWWINFHFPILPDHPSFQKMEYTALTFVCNDFDNRVYCNWQMRNFTMAVNKDFSEGFWQPTT